MANRARKFTRKFGEIFVAKVLWGTFSVPEINWNPLGRVRNLRGLLEKGSFQKSPFLLETLENLEILEFLENPQPVEKKGDSDHFLETLEN